jgi:hypothetical protein
MQLPLLSDSGSPPLQSSTPQGEALYLFCSPMSQASTTCFAHNRLSDSESLVVFLQLLNFSKIQRTGKSGFIALHKILLKSPGKQVTLWATF